VTPDQRNRLRTLAYDAALLTMELRNDRATTGDKAKVRGVLKYLEKANASLDLAIGRAARKPRKANT
jgi:hypothetical protein